MNNAKVQVLKDGVPKTDFILKTDIKGRFRTNSIPAGNHTVTVYVDRETKWVAPHVNVTEGKTVRLELKGKRISEGIDPLATEEFTRLQRANGGSH